MSSQKVKDTTMTFRTSTAAKEKIEALARRVDSLYYKFNWSDPIRDCKTKSGLVHQLVAGKITLWEIELKITRMEEKNASKK